MALFRKYREHKHYAKPGIDWEIQQTYWLIAKGRLIIRALESVRVAGVGRAKSSKLADPRPADIRQRTPRLVSVRRTP
jgi:hypothetical protein